MREWIVGVFVVLALVGCQRKAAEPFADSVAEAALMRVVFPGWEPDTPTPAKVDWVVSDASGAAHDETGWVLVTPALVAETGGDRVVLIVSGRPSDEAGQDASSHASSGNLGAYWFERRAGRWYAAGAQPSFTWTGFSGDVGTLRLVPLGAGRQALAVENGSCWQGQCGQWLSFYEIGADKVSPLLAGDESIASAADVSGATASCEGLLEEKPGARARVALADYSENYGCHGLRGEWEIKPGANGPGELTIRFTGKRTTAERVPLAAPPAAASAPAEEDEEVPTEEYLVTIHPVQETVVYRYRDGLYRLHSGKNPLPGI